MKRYTLFLLVVFTSLIGCRTDDVGSDKPPTSTNRAPVAAMTTPVVNGLAMSVNGSGSSDADGNTLTYQWTFGDGQSASGVSPSHTYAAAGSYTVTLTVNDGSLSNSTNRTVQASTTPPANRAPVAMIGTPVINGFAVSFSGSGSSDPDGNTLTYQWNFGNGQSATGVSASHTYAAAGSYTVTLTVSDGTLSASTNRTVQIAAPNRAPVAVIATPVINGLAVTLNGGGSSDPDGNTLTHRWTFGNGQSATGVSASHTYATAGTYTVTLTVSDGSLSHSATRSVTVSTSTSQFPQPFDTGAVYTRDVYVSTTGNDSSGNGSVSAPFRTLARGLSGATAGTRVRMQAGTYGALGFFGSLRGTAQNPIAIIGDGAVIIDVGRSNAVGMSLRSPTYVVLQGLTIQNTGIHGMSIDDGSVDNGAHHVVLRNMRFRDIGTGGNMDCLKMSGVNNFYITGSQFERCNIGEAIDMVGCHNGTITGNTFQNILQNGVQTKGGSADVLIHGNRFIDVAQRAVMAGGSTDPLYFRPINATYEGSRIQVVANTFLRATSPIAYVGCDTCVFANNTIIDPRQYIARILEQTSDRATGHSGYFINNIIVFNTASISSYVNVGAGTLPGTFTFGWNLWYALDNPNFRGPVYSGGVPAEVSSIIQQDPMLVDRLGGNYHLRAGSPAIGRGRVVPRGVVGDYDRRAFDNPSSLGAFAP